ncbi:hypothetical protein SHAb15599_00001 [Acinetobacter phage SH-Ab 15599]|nr:hypothetical protein SHAb15599_00001 [Acinetobacter phage SH-Ab 15599]
MFDKSSPYAATDEESVQYTESKQESETCLSRSPSYDAQCDWRQN